VDHRFTSRCNRFGNERANGDLDPEFFANLTGERDVIRFSRLDFAAGKLPQSGQALVRGAAAREYFAVSLDDGGHNANRLHAHEPTAHARRRPSIRPKVQIPTL
jgi:hypothetical protein